MNVKKYSQHVSMHKSCYLNENIRRKSASLKGNTMEKLLKIYIPSKISSFNVNKISLKYNLHRELYLNNLCPSQNRTKISERYQSSSINYKNILSTFRNIKHKRKIVNCSLFIPKIRIHSYKKKRNTNLLKLNKLLLNVMKRSKKNSYNFSPLNKQNNSALLNKTINLNGIKFKISKSHKSHKSDSINKFLYYRKNLFNYNFNNYSSSKSYYNSNKLEVDNKYLLGKSRIIDYCDSDGLNNNSIDERDKTSKIDLTKNNKDFIILEEEIDDFNQIDDNSHNIFYFTPEKEILKISNFSKSPQLEIKNIRKIEIKSYNAHFPNSLKSGNKFVFC